MNREYRDSARVAAAEQSALKRNRNIENKNKDSIMGFMKDSLYQKLIRPGLELGLG